MSEVDKKAEDNTEKKDELEEKADEIAKGLSCIQKSLLYPAFFIIKISTLVFLYVGMLIWAMAIIPVLVNSLLSCISKLSFRIELWANIASTIALVIFWYPVFALLISVILKLMSSAFSGFNDKILGSIFGFKSLLPRYFDPKANHKYMILQLLAYVVYDLVCYGILIASFFPVNDSIKDLASGALLIFFSVVIVLSLIGIGRVIILSWRIAIFPYKNDISEFKTLIENSDSEPASEPELGAAREIDNDIEESSYVLDTNDNEIRFKPLLYLDEFDPAHLRKLSDWINLLKNPEITEYRKTSKSHFIICTIFAIIGVFQIIISTSSALSEYKASDKQPEYIINFILPLLSIFLFPFCVILNFVVPLRHCCDGEEKKGLGSLKLVLVIVEILYLLILIAGLCLWGILKAFLSTHQAPIIDFNYVPTENYTGIRGYDKNSIDYPSYCSTTHLTVNGKELHLADIAVLGTIGEYIFDQADKKDGIWPCRLGKYTSSTTAVLRYVLGEQFPYTKTSHYCFDNKLRTSLFTIESGTSQNHSLIFTQGMYQEVSLMALMETYVQQYFPLLISQIIPFASLVIGFFSEGFAYIQFYTQYIMAIVPIVDSVARTSVRSIKKLTNTFEKKPIIFGVGQATGGYLIKLTASALNMTGVAIDSLPLFQTSKAIFSSKEKEIKGDIPVNLLNVNVVGSFVGGYDSNVKQNIFIPAYSSMPTSSFIEACLISAICDTENKYSGFCEQVFTQATENRASFYKEFIAEKVSEVANH